MWPGHWRTCYLSGTDFLHAVLVAKSRSAERIAWANAVNADNLGAADTKKRRKKRQDVDALLKLVSRASRLPLASLERKVQLINGSSLSGEVCWLGLRAAAIQAATERARPQLLSASSRH